MGDLFDDFDLNWDAMGIFGGMSEEFAEEENWPDEALCTTTKDGLHF